MRQFRAAYDEAVANYRQTVRAAFQQVEDNPASLRVLDRVIGEQDEAVAAALNYRAQRMTASVQLVKSLGGGWDAARLPAPSDVSRVPAQP